MLLPSDPDSHTTLPETGITATGRLNVLELMEKTNEQEPNFQVKQLNLMKTQPESHNPWCWSGLTGTRLFTLCTQEGGGLVILSVPPPLGRGRGT